MKNYTYLCTESIKHYTMTETSNPRPIHEIAMEIKKDWYNSLTPNQRTFVDSSISKINEMLCTILRKEGF